MKLRAKNKNVMKSLEIMITYTFSSYRNLEFWSSDGSWKNYINNNITNDGGKITFNI